MKQDYEEFLINVFNQTRNTNKSKYIKEVLNSIESSVVYKTISKEIPLKNSTKVNFVTEGTTIAGRRNATKGHTAILNFADGCKPGGYPECGLTTQEENICRVSTLYEIISNSKFDEDYYQANIKSNGSGFSYGLSTDNILYCKDIVVYKDGKTFDDCKPEMMDVITCPAPSVGISDDTKALNLYTKRIEGIVKSAIINHAEYLVLGAWGCGAFNQNPYLIARAFAEVLNRYSGNFKGVDMAFVPCVGTTGKSKNYQLFLEVFNEYYKGEVVEA